MRKEPIVTGEYYHIYNRGVDKRDIFSDKKDLFRFIESVSEFNRKDSITSLANLRKTEIEAKPLSEPQVAIVGYCLNPNHFHFILKQLIDGGISDFMKKLQGGYTYYFNVKNSRSGSLFQGTFKSHHIDEDIYFAKLLGYVNKNYAVHTIPKNKKELVFSGDHEYESKQFKLIDKKEAGDMLKRFGGASAFKKHCDQIVNIIREERGKQSLFEEDNLPDRG